MSLFRAWRQLVDPPERRALERLVYLLDDDGHRDSAEGRGQLFLELFLPHPPAGVRTTFARYSQGAWRRLRRPLRPSDLLAHLEGRRALGGVHVGPTRILVHDLDNAAGKARPGSGLVDPDLELRVELVRKAHPRAVWVRSSASGGLHAWQGLRDPLPQGALAQLARERLLRAASLQPELARRLALGGLGGVRGFLELHPLGGGQGATLRAPLGPGSCLLDSLGRPLALSTAAAVQALLDHVRGQAEGVEQLFPTDAIAALPILPPRALEPRPGHRTGDLRHLLELCDGRLPVALRPDRYSYLRVLQALWARGLPGPSTRHQATFLLALGCRWDDLDEVAARERILTWFRGVGHRHSKEWTTRASAAERKTVGIIRHVYRDDAPKRRVRFLPAAPIHLADQLVLEHLLEGDGRLVDLAVRILTFARGNGRLLLGRRADRGRFICELPMRRLGVRSAAARRAWQQLQDLGLFKLYAARDPYRPPDHELGPQRARAARYTVYWTFLDAGRAITRRHPIASRARAYLLSLEPVLERIGETLRRRFGRPVTTVREWEGRRWWSRGRQGEPAQVWPVGAVEAVRLASKGLCESRRDLQAPVDGHSPEGFFEGPSMGASGPAASTGPFEAGQPPGEGVRGRGASWQPAGAALTARVAVGGRGAALLSSLPDQVCIHVHQPPGPLPLRPPDQLSDDEPVSEAEIYQALQSTLRLLAPEDVALAG